MTRHRVVIIGAGFGGLECARKLAATRVDVLLIDRNNYHLFTPLLYQVASSLLNPSDIAQPVRAIFRGKRNVRFRQGEVTGLDLARRTVALAGGEEAHYDSLVIAAGSTTNFFGVAGAEDRAHGLKDLGEALELRNHILHSLEAASQSSDPVERCQLLTFAVAGGGPTGVEYAGALSELLKLVIPGEYPELQGERWRVVLIEALPRLLSAFPERLGEEAARELRSKGIEVRLGSAVAEVGAGAVGLRDGEELLPRTLVWAAGVRPSPLAASLDLPRSRTGRIVVDEALSLAGLPNVYAIGDVASFVQDEREVPMLSAPAMQQGRHVARNILRGRAGEPPLPFRYRDRGSMATIGRNDAVAQVGRLQLRGFPGWLVWLFVHLYYLIGFRNRIVVLTGWTWNYLRFDRPVRIIARANQDRDSTRTGAISSVDTLRRPE